MSFTLEMLQFGPCCPITESPNSLTNPLSEILWFFFPLLLLTKLQDHALPSPAISLLENKDCVLLCSLMIC